MDRNSHRMPPQDRDAERALLSCIFHRNDAADVVANVLSGGREFYVSGHQYVFEAMTTLRGVGQPVDIVTVSAWLKAKGKLEDAGGYDYLAELWGDTPVGIANARRYAEIIHAHFVRRSLVQLGYELSDAAQDAGRDVDELLAESEAKVFAISSLGVLGATVAQPVAVDEFAVDLDQRMCRPDGEFVERSIPTGIRDLDHLMTGLHPSELIVVAARTSVGKTLLAVNFALRAAQKGRMVFFASLEMNRVDIVTRMACLQGRVDSFNVRQGVLSIDEQARLKDAIADIHDLPIEYDDANRQTIMKIAANARRLKASRGLALVIVDYLQYVNPGERIKNEPLHEVLGRVTRGLRDIARELKVPVVALAQLNREADARKPRLSDLRASGDIEQDSDTVLLLHKSEAPDQHRPVDLLEIQVAKARNSRTGEVVLAHHKAFYEVTNLALPEFSNRSGMR